jgi:hypothetical protein
MGRVLVRADDGAVHEVQRPIDPTRGIGLGLQGGQDFLPHPGLAPTAEALIDARPSTVALGQVAPGCAGPGDPKHAIDEAPVVAARPPGRGTGQQQLQVPPLPIGQITSLHLANIGAGPPHDLLCRHGRALRP